MRRVFGAKKNTEPPPSIQDASDRVSPLVSNYYSIFLFFFSSILIGNILFKSFVCNVETSGLCVAGFREILVSGFNRV